MDEDKYRAPALSKGLDILELLSTEPRGKTQMDIAKTLGRTPPEIFRMLMVLRQRGYVEQTADGDRYGLTTKMFEIAHRHPPIRRLTSIAGEQMQRLADRNNQSVHLGILRFGKVLVIAQADCPDNNLVSVRLGAQIALDDTATGRVIAAFMDDDRLARLLAEAPATSAERRRDFIAALPEVRRLGCCRMASVTVAGVTNFSAPIRDHGGHVVAAMTIPFVQRLSGTTTLAPQDCLTALGAVCHDISRRLGAAAVDPAVTTLPD